MDLKNIATEEYGNRGGTVECVCINDWRNVAIEENFEIDIENVAVDVNLGKCLEKLPGERIVDWYLKK